MSFVSQSSELTRAAVFGRRPLTASEREVRIGRLLMVPALIVPAALLFVFLAGIFVTLHEWRLTSPDRTFVWLGIYLETVLDAKFWRSAFLTVKFAVVDVAVEVVLGTIMALILAEALPGIRFFRALLILPLMTPPVVGALVWKVLFRAGNGGFFNYVLWLFGLPEQAFLGDPTQAFYSLVVIDVWLNMPFIATILLAGLQTLPQETIDAARIDGANSWQIFWRVKLPMLVPFYIVAMFFRVIDSLNVFDTIYGTTGGGPGDTTRVLSINGYENSFQFFNLSYGLTAFVMLWFVCMLVGSSLYFRIKRAQAD
ncbi:MAG: sugar ABC transporter permease [Chloroflexota bacterium]